jgi:hypothetical protein
MFNRSSSRGWPFMSPYMGCDRDARFLSSVPVVSKKSRGTIAPQHKSVATSNTITCSHVFEPISCAACRLLILQDFQRRHGTSPRGVHFFCILFCNSLFSSFRPFVVRPSVRIVVLCCAGSVWPFFASLSVATTVVQHWQCGEQHRETP